ncbi:MAG TPA: hypothetical protein VHY08_16120 [Bacillota bacterium]|nr:hypothetical protein [Bacillota bacterium]
MRLKFLKLVILAFILLLSPTIQLSSQEGQYQFTGAINGKYRLIMQLKTNGAQVSGTYYYNSTKINIKIQGTIAQDKSIIIREVDPLGNQTGLFKGRWVSEKRIEGDWSKPDGSKVMPFFLDVTVPVNAADLSGEWSNNSVKFYFFSLTLTQTCDNLNGYHSGATANATRIDAVIPDDGNPSIFGTVQGKSAKVKFKSGYSEAAGEALITLKDADTLSWKIINVTDDEFYIPEEALLKRDK